MSNKNVERVSPPRWGAAEAVAAELHTRD
jgi:hypothetical protein